MKKAKKLLQKENDWFDKHGVVGFTTKAKDEITKQLLEFNSGFENFKKNENLNGELSESELRLIEKEYDEFISVVREYHLNLKAASRVSEIFLESAKNTMEQNTKMDHGYNKEGVFISDRQILANMPSMTLNDKV
jgi:hypothetical protein